MDQSSGSSLRHLLPGECQAIIQLREARSDRGHSYGHTTKLRCDQGPILHSGRHYRPLSWQSVRFQPSLGWVESGARWVGSLHPHYPTLHPAVHLDRPLLLPAVRLFGSSSIKLQRKARGLGRRRCAHKKVGKYRAKQSRAKEIS